MIQYDGSAAPPDRANLLSHDQYDGCSCEPKGQAFHQRGCEQFDGGGDA